MIARIVRNCSFAACLSASCLLVLIASASVFAQEQEPESTPVLLESPVLPPDETGVVDSMEAPSMEPVLQDTSFLPVEEVITPLPDQTPLEEGPRVRPLPPIPQRRYGFSTRELYQRIYLEDPSAFRSDSLEIQGIPTENIEDDDLRTMADSLNRRVWLLELQERMMQAELQGQPLQAGRVGYEEFLRARLGLLDIMEENLKTILRAQYAVIDSSVEALDEEIFSRQDLEIEALESYIQQYSNGRYLSDANFVLGQLYYMKEKHRNTAAMRRFLAEYKRFQMGLLPVMPRQDHMNEAIPVPYYRRVIELNTNQNLIPYSLYSLGKYHLDQAKDYTAESELASAMRNREQALEYRRLKTVHMDSAKGYFSRLIVEFNEDSVNVPEAYYVLASHYNLMGGNANRDTATVYANALVRGYWRSPRYQDALMLLAEIHFTNGMAETRDIPRRNRLYSEALAYLAWLLREIDAYQAESVPGVSPENLPMLQVGKRDRYLAFMAEQLCRTSPLARLMPPPPVQETVKLVRASGNPPFGADLLRMVGDKKKRDYDTSERPEDLVAALMAYDSLLTYYNTYEEGPAIQQTIIDNATFLSDDPQERIQIYLQKKLKFFDLFSRNSAWFRQSHAPAAVKQAADDSAAAYLETAAKWFYTRAQAAGDRDGIRQSLDYFVLYFETYPEKPEAYELNWSLATELEQLGDDERAYEQYMRISNAQQQTYRKQAANGAVEAAFRLLDMETRNEPQEQGGEGE